MTCHIPFSFTVASSRFFEQETRKNMLDMAGLVEPPVDARPSEPFPNPEDKAVCSCMR